MHVLEAFQTEQALIDRLAVLAAAEVAALPGSIEADMVAHGIRYTGAALTRLQVELYGEDEPDEPVWLPGHPDDIILAGWSEPELREAFGS